MPDTPILILRFPDGDVEWRSTRGELPVGAKVRARGTVWRIREYAEGGAAILESAEVPVEGAAGGALANPLGFDEPLTVEILAAA